MAGLVVGVITAGAAVYFWWRCLTEDDEMVPATVRDRDRGAPR